MDFPPLPEGSIISKLFLQKKKKGKALITITIGEVSTLNHEGFDNSMESRAFVAKTLLSRSKSPEILCSLGCRFAIETNDNSTQWLIAMSDVKVDLLML